MSRYDDFPPYVSVAEKKAKAQAALEKLRKKDPAIAPIVVTTGRKLTKTWWGGAWNANLESYADYASRIARGRSYVRQGSVLDLKMTSGKVTAVVQGSQTKPYQVSIAILPLATETWEEIIRACEGKIESLQELREGKFPESLAELFTLKGHGLFPSPKEIKFSCSCPDFASMCKHVAATLYGTGIRMDEDPALFFTLRGVDMQQLVAKAIAQKTESLLEKSGRKSRRVIEGPDIGALFGVDMAAESPTVSAATKDPKRRPPRTTGR